jgi:dTDP-4-dehydrorhamnose 3,5-epimerase
MTSQKNTLHDVLIIEENDVIENLNLLKFKEFNDNNIRIVQDIKLYAEKAMLFGLHYQINRPQGKLISVSLGEVFNVIVDIQEKSNTYGKYKHIILTEKNKKKIWIPEGFAHGYLILSENATINFKLTDYTITNYQRCINHDDPEINIQWPIVVYEYPIGIDPIVSENDKQGKSFNSAEKL